MKYALVRSNSIIRFQDFPSAEDVPILHGDKGVWLPVVADYAPGSFKDSIHDITWTVDISASVVNESIVEKDLQEVKSTLLDALHRNTKNTCLAEYPETVQLSALAGRYSPEECARITDGVTAHFNAYHAKKTTIEAALTAVDALAAFEA